MAEPKRNRLADWPFWLIWLAAVATTTAVYADLPEMMPTHWNAAGEVDGWSPRAPAVAVGLLMPIAIFFLMEWLPRFDPHRANYARFGGAYFILRLAISLMLVGLYFVMLLWALDIPLAMERVVPVALGLLFMVMGNVLGQVRRNYFVGIRTPWTLASEETWRRTHRLGGRLFVLAGLMMTASGLLFSGTLTMILTLVGVLGVVVATFVYSYLVFKQHV